MRINDELWWGSNVHDEEKMMTADLINANIESVLDIKMPNYTFETNIS